MKLYLLFVSFFFILGCNKTITTTYKNPNLLGKFDTITFKDIIQSPNKYQGKNIELCGFYKYSFEKSAFYSTKFNNDSKQAIWIDFHKDLPLINTQTGINLLDSYKELEKISDRYIRIRGRFNMNLKGHLENYFGELDNVMSIEVFK